MDREQAMQWPIPQPENDAVAFERAYLCIPHLPAGLDGLTLLQISDTHVSKRNAAGRDLHTRLLDQLDRPDPGLPEIDMVVLSGDYMSVDGDEPMATEALRDLVHAAAKLGRMGCFGVFGNHDHAELKDAAMDRTRSEGWPVRWMHSAALPIDGLPLELIGSDWPERYEAITGAMPSPLREGAPFRLALGHNPDCTPDAHRAGAHLVLAGHTHGGQVRVPTPRGGVLAAFTASELIPRRAPSGIYRFRRDGTPVDRSTMLGVTRGVGFQMMPMRINCPPQAVLYTLRCEHEGSERAGAPMPQEPAGPVGRLEVVRVW